MPDALVALHAHTRTGSNDGSLTPRELATGYVEAGFSAVAITDHDVETPPPDVPGIVTIPGIEHTLDASRHLHVVELPTLNFRFLAHPSIPFPQDTRRKAVEFAADHGLDGVEKFNGHVTEYEGRIDGLHELATDDAHNSFHIGQSYLAVEGPVRSPQDVGRALRRGAYQPVSNPALLPAVAGRLTKGAAVVRHEIDRMTGHGDVPDRKTPLYDPDDRRRY